MGRGGQGRARGEEGAGGTRGARGGKEGARGGGEGAEEARCVSPPHVSPFASDGRVRSLRMEERKTRACWPRSRGWGCSVDYGISEHCSLRVGWKGGRKGGEGGIQDGEHYTLERRRNTIHSSSSRSQQVRSLPSCFPRSGIRPWVVLEQRVGCRVAVEEETASAKGQTQASREVRPRNGLTPPHGSEPKPLEVLFPRLPRMRRGGSGGSEGA